MATTYLFQPPATQELPRTLAKPHRDDRFWSHFRRGKVGSSILKDQAGNYTTIDTPSQDQINASALVYLGGHVYEIDDQEASRLTAAGYTVDGYAPTFVSYDWDDVATRYYDPDDLAARAYDWDHI